MDFPIFPLSIPVYAFVLLFNQCFLRFLGFSICCRVFGRNGVRIPKRRRSLATIAGLRRQFVLTFSQKRTTAVEPRPSRRRLLQLGAAAAGCRLSLLGAAQTRQGTLGSLDSPFAAASSDETGCESQNAGAVPRWSRGCACVFGFVPRFARRRGSKWRIQGT